MLPRHNKLQLEERNWQLPSAHFTSSRWRHYNRMIAARHIMTKYPRVDQQTRRLRL